MPSPGVAMTVYAHLDNPLGLLLGTADGDGVLTGRDFSHFAAGRQPPRIGGRRRALRGLHGNDPATIPLDQR